MPSEMRGFEHLGDEHQARKEDARLNAEIDAFEESERAEPAKYIKETERFLSWVTTTLSRHAVGKEPGTHLDMLSPIGDLIAFAERDAQEEITRHNYEQGNNISAMISKLKDGTFAPPEALTIGELYSVIEKQLGENKRKLGLLKREGE